MATLNLKVTLPDTKATLVRDFVTGQVLTGRERLMQRLLNLLLRLSSGTRTGSMSLNVTDASTTASATATCVSAAVADTVTINGVVFTAVASGATGNQFNQGGTDTTTAASLALAINSSVTAKVAGVVAATSAVNVVTISSVQGGSLGNINTLVSSNGARLAVTGSGYLAGGTDSLVSLSY